MPTPQTEKSGDTTCVRIDFHRSAVEGVCETYIDQSRTGMQKLLDGVLRLAWDDKSQRLAAIELARTLNGTWDMTNIPEKKITGNLDWNAQGATIHVPMHLVEMLKTLVSRGKLGTLRVMEGKELY